MKKSRSSAITNKFPLLYDMTRQKLAAHIHSAYLSNYTEFSCILSGIHLLVAHMFSFSFKCFNVGLRIGRHALKQVLIYVTNVLTRLYMVDVTLVQTSVFPALVTDTC